MKITTMVETYWNCILSTVICTCKFIEFSYTSNSIQRVRFSTRLLCIRIRKNPSHMIIRVLGSFPYWFDWLRKTVWCKGYWFSVKTSWIHSAIITRNVPWNWSLFRVLWSSNMRGIWKPKDKHTICRDDISLILVEIGRIYLVKSNCEMSKLFLQKHLL